MFIYKITNLINGKCYIGLDTGPCEELRRWNSHKSGYKTHKGKSKLYNAFKKYGIENFICEIIDNSKTAAELRIREEFWIKTLNTCKSGYNILPSANGGWTLADMSEEDRKIKIEACKKGFIKTNEIKWKLASPEIIQNNKDIARKNLNIFYEGTDRSIYIKHDWNNLSEEERFNKSRGLRNHWKNLTEEEKSKRGSIGSIAALKTNAKHFLITDKNRVQYTVIGLGIFCKEMNINEHFLRKVATGRLDNWEGWTCYEINKDTGTIIIPEKFIPKKTGPKRAPKEIILFKMTSPDGIIYEVEKIMPICRLFKLSQNKIMNLANKIIDFYKGWKIEQYRITR